MENVRGFNDMRQPSSAEHLNRVSPRRQSPSHSDRLRQRQHSDDRFDPQQWTYNIENLQAVEKHKVLFLSGSTQLKNPRQENYWDLLKGTCCPVISCISVTVLLMVAILTMFIVSIAKGIDKEGELLQIEAKVLFDLGANHSPSVEDGEVWRLVTAIFLHVTFIHFFGNMLTLIIFVSRFEYTFGWWKTVLIFLVSGIGGNIFSNLTDPSETVVKAGASTALYGIIGAILGYVIINWRGFDVIGKLLKCQLVCISIVIVLFIFILTPYTQNIDYLGHLGGFITGFCLTAIHSTIRNQKRQKIMRVAFLATFVGFFLLCFLLFYLA